LGVTKKSEQYQRATVETATNLKTIVSAPEFRSISKLSLPEIEAITNMIARIVPAGNVPGVIANSLARLAQKHVPANDVRRDVNLLFRGVDQMLDRVVHAAVFAGPAAILGAYHLLLKLVGKEPEAAFPDGTWQFYVEYALREDTARHANETHGFDTALRQHSIQLSEMDRITAWVMAGIDILHQYDDLLENEWRERVYLRLLAEQLKDDDKFRMELSRLYRSWLAQKPYRRSKESPAESYPAYRRRKFDQFLENIATDLSRSVVKKWQAAIHSAEKKDLPAYLRQMSILSYLEPGEYGETRVPVAREQAFIGVIHRGGYHLIRICEEGSSDHATLENVRSQVAAMLEKTSVPFSRSLSELVDLRRAELAAIRKSLNEGVRDDLNALKLAPILINVDQLSGDLPLSEIRQADRGVGDHPLTIFRTEKTYVFDQSHIYFDGGWGAALAEIFTNEALSWAAYLHNNEQLYPRDADALTLRGSLTPEESEQIKGAPRVTREAGAENAVIDVNAIVEMRKTFKKRSDLIQLTVNDLLILYRAIHARTYQPDRDVAYRLNQLASKPTTEATARATITAINAISETNPAVLIPVDASLHHPADRLYPMTFEVPLGELEVIGLHAKTLEALTNYRRAEKNRAEQYKLFDELQRTYLASLAGFGSVLSRAKEIAVSGESASVGSIKMLAYLPASLQKMLDQIPGRFDVLNDIIKGREVFSNVGAVAPGSTLTRFISAKDDNQQKTLVWGVLTDSSGKMKISLRDFRPHVEQLTVIGERDLAQAIVQDYLDSYADGLNQYVKELHHITQSSRDTLLKK
jgi:hypothetical protein